MVQNKSCLTAARDARHPQFLYKKCSLALQRTLLKAYL